MKRFFKVHLLLSVLFCSFSSYAQHLTSSPYSRYGIGELNLRTFGQGTSLAGTSIGIRSTYHINPANPASLTAIPRQTFILEAGLSSKFTTMESNASSDKSSATNIAYFGFAFPITKWMGMSIGFMPYSNIGYKISSTQNINNNQKELYATANMQYEGSGGLTQYYISTGIKPFKGLSIGGSIYALIGSTEHSSSTSVVKDSSEISNISGSTSIKIKDVNYSFGIQYEYKLGKNNICLGAVLDNKKDYNALSTASKYTTISGSVTTNQDDTTSTDGSGAPGYGKISIPSNLGLGLSYSNDKYLIAFDYYEQDWTKARFFGQADQNLTTSHRYSMGVEYTPDVMSARYWKFVRYKLGAYVSDNYVQMPTESGGKQGIKEYGVTVGLDLPILNKSFSLLCPSFQFGSRGTTANGLIREKFFIVHLNFTMNDRWFMKRKID